MDNTAFRLKVTCACGAELEMEGSRWEQSWIEKQFKDWRAEHVCPKRNPT